MKKPAFFLIYSMGEEMFMQQDVGTKKRKKFPIFLVASMRGVKYALLNYRRTVE